jgi:hypothetical protein
MEILPAGWRVGVPRHLISEAIPRLVLIPLVVLALLSFAGPAAAQNTWMSGGHPVPLWSNAGAWSLGVVPDGSTDISILDGTVGDDVSFTNRNTLKVGAPATLTIFSPTTVTNQGASAFINNSGSFVNNGTVVNASFGTLNNGGTLTNNATLFNELGGQLNNSGTLDNFGTLDNRISGFVVNTGNINNQSGGFLINDLSSTIQNDHSIANEAGATFSNSGTLNGSGIFVNFGTVDNSGQLSSVVFNLGGTINNSGGSIRLGDGSDIVGGTLGGAAGNVLLTGAGATATLDGSNNTGFGALTIKGTYTGDVGTTTNVLGTINNQGNIQVLSTGRLFVLGDAALQGGGTVTLGGGQAIDSLSGHTLTNVDNTIQGAGILFVPNLVNQSGGTVNANVSSQDLTLAPLTITNAGLLEATNGGQLRIGSGLSTSTVTNTGGTIVADGGTVVMAFGSLTGGSLTALNGGTVTLIASQTQGATITALNGGLVNLGFGLRAEGETITAMNGGTVQLSGAQIFGGTLNNVSGTLGTIAQFATLDGSTGFGAVTIQGTYTGGANSTTNLLGTINNQGNIQVLNTGTVLVQGDATLQGGGTVTLGGAKAIASLSGMTLTNLDNTIQGTGNFILSNLVNQSGGTINANVSGQSLSFGAPTMTNAGLLEATNGGKLETGFGIFVTTINNAGGTIAALDGGIVTLNNTTVMGGTLNNLSGTLETGVATLDGSTAAGAVTIQGTLTNVGRTEILGTINNQGTVLSLGSLSLFGDTTLQGGGTVTLASSGTITAIFPGLTLTNVDNTIQGAGGFSAIGTGLQVVNQAAGTILPNTPGDTMTFNTVALTNAGTVQVNAGSTLQVLAPFTQMGGKTQVDGTMLAAFGENISGGAMLGTGTINGNVTMTGGTMHPGGANVPGTLTINGDFLQTSSLFDELIGSTGHGLLLVNGNVLLDPSSLLNIDLVDGFALLSGETFTIMDFTSLTGTFANAPTSGFVMDGFNWTIAYNANDIVLDAVSPVTGGGGGGGGNSVPEPGTGVLLLTALLLGGLRFRKRSPIART